MPTAFVLINTEIGSESDVLKDMKKVEGVEEASAVYGVYDIVARVKADTRYFSSFANYTAKLDGFSPHNVCTARAGTILLPEVLLVGIHPAEVSAAQPV